MGNIYKKLAGQTAIYGTSSIIGRLLNYLLVPLYTRLFAPEVYGVVVELYAYVGFLLVVLTYGMETGFFRFADKSRTKDTVFSTIITSLAVTTATFVALVYILLEPISELLNYSENPEYLLWMALIVAIDVLVAIPFAKLRLFNKAVKFAAIKIINIGINISSNLFFLLLCPYLVESNPNSLVNHIYSPEIGVGYVFISNLIANIITLLILLPEIIRVNYHFDAQQLKKILIYSSPLLIAGLAGMINETLDRILLKFLIPEELNPMKQIGIYGANYKLAVLMTLFIQMFRYAVEPFFFTQYKEKGSEFVYAQVMKYFIICGLCIFLGVMLFLNIIKHFIAVEYHSGLHIVPILLLANLFLGITYNLSVWYKVKDLTKYGALIALFGAAVTVVLNIVLIPRIGYLGSAYATLACYSLMAFLSFLWGRTHFKIPYDFLSILKYFAIAGLVYAIFSYIKPETSFLQYTLSSVLFLSFIAYAFFKENIYTKFFNK